MQKYARQACRQLMLCIKMTYLQHAKHTGKRELLKALKALEDLGLRHAVDEA